MLAGLGVRTHYVTANGVRNGLGHPLTDHVTGGRGERALTTVNILLMTPAHGLLFHTRGEPYSVVDILTSSQTKSCSPACELWLILFTNTWGTKQCHVETLHYSTILMYMHGSLKVGGGGVRGGGCTSDIVDR